MAKLDSLAEAMTQLMSNMVEQKQQIAAMQAEQHRMADREIAREAEQRRNKRAARQGTTPTGGLAEQGLAGLGEFAGAWDGEDLDADEEDSSPWWVVASMWHKALSGQQAAR